MKVVPVLILLLPALLEGCVPASIKEAQNSYSYLGRVADAIDESVTEQVSRPNPLAIGLIPHAVVGAMNNGDTNVIVDKKSSYRRYKVALEQGETITLRSYVSDIKPADCVRVWIAGPGVSPVYWYAPDQAQIERATNCK